jgi:signal transduction histidine kinase
MESSPEPKRTSDQPGVSSRLALIAGFGGLLAIVALGGVDALRVLRQMRREDDQIRRQFLSRNHVLNDIRSQLYLSGTYVRDYLLDPEQERAETHRTSLEGVRREMESALASYGKEVESGSQAPYVALRDELSNYWKTIDPILKWSTEERRTRGYAFLRDDVFPRRTAMLEVAGQIADINEQQLNAGNEEVVGLLVKFQTRLAVTLFSTLILGLGMAAFSTRRILNLEAHAMARYQEVAEARTQMTNLSDRLIRAQETERRALSRELHDEVGQSLSAVLVELRNLSTGLGARSEEQLRTHVDVIKGLVESTVRVIRNMSLLLRPSMLDDLGLVPALRWQAREASKRTSMDVSVATDSVSDHLPDDYKTCIYRVVQEALNNCSRHSQASTVRIRVQQTPTLLSLSIQDDGRGFDVTHTKGLGLLGMEERVSRLGGKWEVHSAPGSGTILAIELPVRESENGQGADK